MGKQTVRTNLSKNRIYIISEGFFSDIEIIDGYNTVICEIEKLKPGFICISDISKFKPATPFGAQKLQELSRELIKHGLRKVIQVNCENQLAEMQIERIVEDELHGMVVQVCTMAEADHMAEILEQLELER